MNSTTRLLHQAEICGFVQTGIREGYQAKKGDNQRYSIGIMVLFMEIYWGYMLFIS
jgi:hypothetical protein